MGRSYLPDKYVAMHGPLGARHPRASADISGKSRLPTYVTYVCYVQAAKNRPNLLASVLVIYSYVYT